jgi:regulatory protein
MRGDTEAAAGSTEVDPVSAAREWLLRHGVDPGDAREAGGEVDPPPPSTTLQGGYERSRRAPSMGSTGRSISRRPPRGRRTDPDAEDDVDVGDGDGARGAGPGTTGPDADPQEVARGIVLGKLAAQARTRVELERALQSRDVPEEAAAVVLDRMSEVGLVDDATFARDWVSSRQQRRHLSKTALRRELQTKGVDRDLIDEALADVDGSDEHRAALDLARRRAATMGGLARDVAYRRLGGVLARRGFSPSTTARVLAEVLGDSTDGD